MKWAGPLLLVLGLLQMAGDVTGLDWLRGIGAASSASPAPRVFSAVDGLETYSTRFFLEWTDTRGASHSLELRLQIRSFPVNRDSSCSMVRRGAWSLRTWDPFEA